MCSRCGVEVDCGAPHVKLWNFCNSSLHTVCCFDRKGHLSVSECGGGMASWHSCSKIIKSLEHPLRNCIRFYCQLLCVWLCTCVHVSTVRVSVSLSHGVLCCSWHILCVYTCIRLMSRVFPRLAESSSALWKNKCFTAFFIPHQNGVVQHCSKQAWGEPRNTR